MENTNRQAKFLERFLAYIIDLFIVAILSTTLSFPFAVNNTEKIEKINEELNTLTQSFYNQEIDVETYMVEAPSVSYELSILQRNTILVTIFIYIMYYIVLQFYTKGQTIGKKLLKIKITSNTGKLGINQIILRELLIYNILISIIEIALIYFGAGSFTYFYVGGILEFIQMVFVLISVLMIMFSKKTRGLHDYIANTDVVKI